MQDPESMHMQAINKMQIFPGTPFMRGLVPAESIARIVVSAPCSEAEQQRLRTLGASMGLNKLDAESYLKRCPASFMPLHLRQSMILCPARNCLTPLSELQLHSHYIETQCFSRLLPAFVLLHLSCLDRKLNFCHTAFLI
jgi:hypothetical protein